MRYSSDEDEYTSNEEGEDLRTPSERQEGISEALQLLHIIGARPCDAYRKYRKITPSAEDREELAFLRAITTFAVGDSLQDQLAVTRCLFFSGPTFVCAMNRPASLADRQGSRSSFKTPHRSSPLSLFRPQALAITHPASDHRPEGSDRGVGWLVGKFSGAMQGSRLRRPR
ncbi:hypothetical protein FA95DRAFT_1555589 [Auriscalpium vulgare]|uniref:Uncharacterized protein n=1 Tax=Auriscalpium vulgare TaxID=40419 RepID=A0ACB8S384_9AGAM|nr:hypothetical protein FA95DRAFT_1555589 [Auriscalpium vulgare]